MKNKTVEPDDFHILTFKGHLVDLSKGPIGEQIDIEDIAHHLAFQNRYVGATNSPYSIAEHCIYVALMANKLHKKYYLLHDSAEAWYHDLTKPLKLLIRAHTTIYDDLTEQCDKLVFPGLGLQYEGFKNLYADIKKIDLFVYSLERKRLCGRPLPLGLPDDHPLAKMPFGMHYEAAEEMFLEVYNSLD